MSALISFTLCLFYLPFSYQRWITYFRPDPYPLEEINITMSCYYHHDDTEYETFHQNASLTFEIRPNKKHDWISLAYISESGPNSKTGEYNEDVRSIFSNVSFTGYCGSTSGYISVEATFKTESCRIDSKFNPSFRCRYFGGNSFSDSVEKNVTAIKGRPPEQMSGISIIHQNTLQTNVKTEFQVGDVLQFQCIGEVQTVNSLPSLDIRWCKKQKGRFSILKLQEIPTTNITYRSSDGCTVRQSSDIFYHITHHDEDLEIMCESGYNKSNHSCGVAGANSKIFIPTNVTNRGENKWRLSPILIYNRNSRLNPESVEIDGSGMTIHLLSTASIVSQNSSKMNINWCVRKGKEKIWTKVSLQEDIKEAKSDSGGEVEIYNEIEYHVTKLHTDIHFRCEISRFSSCGSGLASSKISLHFVASDGTHQQNSTESSCNMAGLSVVLVLLILLLVFINLCVLVLCRRKKIRLFGWVLRMDCENKERTTTKESVEGQPKTNVTSTSQTKGSDGRNDGYVADPTLHNNSSERENRIHANTAKKQETSEEPSEHYEIPNSSSAIERDTVYTNEVLENENNTLPYEELKFNQQEYDDLKF